MKNFLRKILFLFVIGLLNQSYIENTCFASKPTKDLNAIGKDDIWDIIVEIANGKVQPKLDYDMQKILGKYNIEAKEKITFAEFVRNLNWKTLVDCLLEKNVLKLGDEENTLKGIIYTISNMSSGKLLLVRIGIANQKSTNSTKQIKIKFGDVCNINFKDNLVSINQNIADSVCYTTFSKTKGENDSILMNGKSKEAGIDVALFHELVHAFHRIDNACRRYAYSLGGKLNCKVKTMGELAKHMVRNAREHHLFKYYYKNVWSEDEKKLKISLMPWHVKDSIKDEFYVNFEEMLTIAGLPVGAEGYEPGDELSENLYRRENGLPLRFGHKMFTYYESKEVYESVKSCVETNLKAIEILSQGQEYAERFSEEESEQYVKIEGLSEKEGFNGMYYYTIDETHDFLVDTKFKEPLKRIFLSDSNEESLYYYIKTCYNNNVLDGNKFLLKEENEFGDL